MFGDLIFRNGIIQFTLSEPLLLMSLPSGILTHGWVKLRLRFLLLFNMRRSIQIWSNQMWSDRSSLYSTSKNLLRAMQHIPLSNAKCNTCLFSRLLHRGRFNTEQEVIFSPLPSLPGQIHRLFWSFGRLLQHRLSRLHRNHLCHLQKGDNTTQNSQ